MPFLFVTGTIIVDKIYNLEKHFLHLDIQNFWHINFEHLEFIFDKLWLKFKTV